MCVCMCGPLFFDVLPTLHLLSNASPCSQNFIHRPQYRHTPKPSRTAKHFLYWHKLRAASRLRALDKTSSTANIPPPSQNFIYCPKFNESLNFHVLPNSSSTAELFICCRILNALTKSQSADEIFIYCRTLHSLLNISSIGEHLTYS